MKKLYIICLFVGVALSFHACTKIVDPDDPTPNTSNVSTPTPFYPACFVEEMTQVGTAFTFLENSFDSYNRFAKVRTILPFSTNGLTFVYNYPNTLKVQEDLGTENGSSWFTPAERTKYELNRDGFATMAVHYDFIDTSALVPMAKDTTHFYYDEKGHLIHISRKFVDYDAFWNVSNTTSHTQDIQYSFVNDTIISSRKQEMMGGASTDSIFAYSYYTNILDAGEYYPNYKDPTGISQMYILRNAVNNSMLPIFGNRIAYLVKSISSMGNTTTFVHDIDSPSKNPRAITITTGVNSSQILWTNHCKQ